MKSKSPLEKRIKKRYAWSVGNDDPLKEEERREGSDHPSQRWGWRLWSCRRPFFSLCVDFASDTKQGERRYWEAEAIAMPAVWRNLSLYATRDHAGWFDFPTLQFVLDSHLIYICAKIKKRPQKTILEGVILLKFN